MSKRNNLQKKEQLKAKLLEQYNQEKRKNRQLKEKSEENDMMVSQFLSDMGQMIDNAEQE